MIFWVTEVSALLELDCFFPLPNLTILDGKLFKKIIYLPDS